MKFAIKLTPINTSHGFVNPVVSKQGDKLLVNNEDFNFSQMEDGDILPVSAIASDSILSDVVRIGDTIHLTMPVYYGFIPFPAPPEAHAVLFPAPLLVETDGVIAFPSYSSSTE